jgi:hypothetical protein
VFDVFGFAHDKAWASEGPLGSNGWKLESAGRLFDEMPLRDDFKFMERSWYELLTKIIIKILKWLF